MGCGRHLLLLLLVCPASFTASFSSCLRSDLMERFWQSPWYAAENPNVYLLPGGYFYTFQFDNASQGLELSDIDIADGAFLLNRVPPGGGKEFSEAASALDSSRASLLAARGAQESAHALSISAQESVSKILQPWALLLLASGPAQLPLAVMQEIAVLAPIRDYVQEYPQEHAAFLSHLSDAYDSANLAKSLVAQKTDRKRSELELAGAGHPSYSGGAKEALFLADSLLLPSSDFCEEGQWASEIYDYSFSRPGLPDFSSAGLADYLQASAGKGEGSSVIGLASLYSLLDEALLRMDTEYEEALLSARQSESSLSEEVSSLGGEELQLIGEPSPPAGSQGILQVGGGFSGIESGLVSAKARLSEARNYLSMARSARAQTKAEGYLAQAISGASASRQASESALVSLRGVRSSAEAAVFAQKTEAQSAIAKAESSLGGKPLSFAGAAAEQAAGELLSQAKQEFSLAGAKPTLGNRFSSYKKATELARQSERALSGKESAGAKDAAGRSLSSLSGLLPLAEKDGLDVGYERGKLRDFQSLLGLAASEDAYFAIAEAAGQERESLLARLREKYSHLEPRYSRALALVSELRTQDSQFLQQFDSLSRFFPAGRLDAQAAAGHLSEIEGGLDSFDSAAKGRLPSYLSSLLSRNAEAHELYEQPVLGEASRYSATITARNPSQFGYAGRLSFTVPTAAQLYSADLAEGDSVADVYPDSGSTAIQIYGIEAGQALSFYFEKSEQPAQITSSDSSCEFATSERADLKRAISFFSSRPIPLLGISEEMPSLPLSGRAEYAGKGYSLSPSALSQGFALSGNLPNVPQGKGTAEVSYSLSSPFTVSSQGRSYETLSLGQKRVSFWLDVKDAAADCGSAFVSLHEPYSGISNLTVSSLSIASASGARLAQSGSASAIQFAFSPLAKGRDEKFLVSYVVTDPSLALSEALSQARLQYLLSNSTADAEALASAQLLASQNRTGEALSLLSSLLGRPSSSQDYQFFLQENSSAALYHSAALRMQGELEAGSMTSAAASLAKLSHALGSSLVLASDEAKAGGFKKSLEIIRKASGEYRGGLASLAWKSSSDAAKAYAAMRKAAAQPDEGALARAQLGLSRSESLYSQGDLLGSYLASSLAMKEISSLSGPSLAAAGEISRSAERLAADYQSLRAEVDSLVLNYSSQYSSLSAQSKKQMPLTPSQAQSRMGEADKAINSLSKAKEPTSAQLAAANASREKLLSLQGALQDSLSSLEESASSSLRVASIALSEARQKAPSSQELPQMEEELSRAQEYYGSGLYADSLVSSDRVVRAANALLSSQQGPDAKAVVLAALSMAFLAAAAYYFAGARKKQGQKEKKEMPKAVDAQKDGGSSIEGKGQ